MGPEPNDRTAGALPERAGHDEIKKRLCERYRRPLLAYFQRRLNDRSEAEDLTQDVFLRLLAVSSFDAVDNVDAYVFKVATNVLHDRHRRALRQHWQDESPLDEEIIAEIASFCVEDRGPERVLLGKEALATALKALDELGDRTRNIFVLSRLERMKQKDIAVLYGITASTVEKHVLRAVAHITLRLGAP
jgi:RNA polymerase sigma factor (sigma-70 family)